MQMPAGFVYPILDEQQLIALMAAIIYPAIAKDFVSEDQIIDNAVAQATRIRALVRQLQEGAGQRK